MNIISIGDLVTDFYYKNGKLIGLNGGMTSHNIIANLSVLGHSTKVIGVCGNDATGNIAIKSLEDLGVDTTNVLKKDICTRCFHVSYFEKDGNLDFTSKKRCPICNNKKWYDKSELSVESSLKSINEDDIVVIDNLNEINTEIISELSNDKMLDLGQYFEFENKTDDEIITMLLNKFSIIQMNERVEKYLIKRFDLKNIKNLYELIVPNLLIVTRGKKGAEFVYSNKVISKKTKKIVSELDSTGAGDAFFSNVISEYILYNRKVSDEMIDSAYENASKMTAMVVKKMGARGHLNDLYKIKSTNDLCSCDDFKIVPKRKIKRVNINVNSLEKRVLNALDSIAVQDLESSISKIKSTSLFVGTGGSYAAAYFASRVINELKGITTIANYPREILYRNNTDLDKVFLFSYSGTTSDLFFSTKNIDKENVIVITKGEKNKIIEKVDLKSNNVISYNNGLCKGKERGFLSFEGAVAPSALFLNILLKKDTKSFIINSFKYWDEYFEKYFKENRDLLKELLKKDNILNLFKGDYTNTCAIDLESKIIESGIYNLIVHEKKNFSHGRFINLEHQRNDCYLYLKQKSTSEYETKLLNYLSEKKTIIIESKFDGLEAEFDLLIASQFFMYYVSILLNIDISKPEYSEESMKIYFYKGEL